MRVARIMIAAAVVFLVAWVIKAVLGDTHASRKAQDLVERIRMSGV